MSSNAKHNNRQSAREPETERAPVFVASSIAQSLLSDVPAHLLEANLKLKIGSANHPAVMSPPLPHLSYVASSQLLAPALLLNLDLTREMGAGMPGSACNSALATPTPGFASGHSVSFCEANPLEKSRRFTILAQPLSALLTTSMRLNPTQQMPLRKPSCTENAADIFHGNSVLDFLATSRAEPVVLLTQENKAASHATSPIPPEFGPRFAFSSYTPSLVLSRKNSGHLVISGQPKRSTSLSNYSIAAQLGGPSIAANPNSDILSSRRASHQSSEGASVPICMLKNNWPTKKSNKRLVLSSLVPPVPFQQFLSKEDDKKFHILLACTGSVATIKVPLIIDKLFQVFGSNKISVQLVATKYACHFLKGLKIHQDVKIWRDEDVWTNLREGDANANKTTKPTATEQATKKQKSPYDKLSLNNELRKWADIMLIAPLSANTLAKIANGLADNLLTSIVRSWGPTSGSEPNCARKPILVAPAMNTYMYTNPLTRKHLKILTLKEEGFGMEVLKPVEKVLVCGDIGMGGMREWLDIVAHLKCAIKTLLAEKVALAGSFLSEDFEEEEEKDENENDENDDDDEDDDDEDDDEDEDDDDDDDDDDDGHGNEDGDETEKDADDVNTLKSQEEGTLLYHTSGADTSRI